MYVLIIFEAVLLSSHNTWWHPDFAQFSCSSIKCSPQFQAEEDGFFKTKITLKLVSITLKLLKIDHRAM